MTTCSDNVASLLLDDVLIVKVIIVKVIKVIHDTENDIPQDGPVKPIVRALAKPTQYKAAIAYREMAWIMSISSIRNAANPENETGKRNRKTKKADAVVSLKGNPPRRLTLKLATQQTLICN